VTAFFRFFAERNLLAYLITIIVILLGLSTLTHIKRDEFPQVEFGELFITTGYPGASPEDVELKVTNKIEDELKAVTGIKRFVSHSVENVSIVHVTIDPDEDDQDEIKQEVRDAVNRVADFPQEVTEAPIITEIKTSIFPIIEVGLAGDIPYSQLREIARLAEKKLKDIPGVARLDRFGYRDREVQIEIFPEAIDEYEIPLRDVIRAIQHRNVRSTGGTFESYTSEKNIVTLAQFRDPREVEEVVVRGTFDGPLIKIKDLGVVHDGFEDERVLSRMNGRSAISFVVHKTASADIIRTVNAIKSLVEQEKARLPKGVEILYSNDESRYVRNRFASVLSNGAIGLFLLLVVLATLLNIRVAFWVALGIPIALLGVIFMLPAFDAFLDSVTLTAMILVLGIIVDDAIIISENIYRRFELGDPPLIAAVEGVKEVFLPVLATILTTFVAFAPMFYMPGLMGKFVFVIPLVITIALFVTLIESTLALPAHLIPGLRRRKQDADETTKEHWFTALRQRYQVFVYRLLRFRYVIVGVFIFFLVGSLGYAYKFMDFVLFPSTAADQFSAAIVLPAGSSLNATSNKVREIERVVDDLGDKELVSYTTRVGGGVSESENIATLTVNLTPFNRRDRTADEVIEHLREQTSKLEGIQAIYYFVKTGGPPVGRPITLRAVGVNDVLRKKLADNIEALLNTIDGVKDIDRDDKEGKQQIELDIDYDQLARSGFSVADIARTVRAAYDGEVVTSVRYGEEDVDFRVVFPKKARRDFTYLSQLSIPNRDGQLVPLKQVAKPKIGPGAANYFHFNGERAISVVADVEKNLTTPLTVTRKVVEHFDLDREYPGVRIVVGGEAEETQKSTNDLLITFLLAVIGIYFLLILLFNSLTQPFIVMAAVPFGITGVIITFALHGEPFGFLAMIGVIGLAGVVVNDSLVLVNHVNMLRKARPGDDVVTVVAAGSADRLRAIGLTTVTTVVGLLPLAYGIGGADPYISPMTLALGYGLLLATPLTLILVPCLYVISHDVYRLFRRDNDSGQPEASATQPRPE